MTSETAAKLARGLLDVHRDEEELHFEVDTHENAIVLAGELERLGCEVNLHPHSTRMQIMRPTG